MNQFIKTLFLVTIIAIPIILIFFYIDSNQKVQEVEKQEKPQEEKSQPFSGLQELDHQEEALASRTQIETTQPLKQTAWIPPWDYKNGLESLNNFESEFHSISPVTFQINNDGSLTERLDPNLSDLKEITKSKDMLLIPTISNFDSNTMKNIFDSVENTHRHIISILQVIEDYGYDGIDLDYESLKKENKKDFLNFVEILSKELSKKEKILSITVLPQWGDGVIYTGLAETRNVQNWETLGKWADEIRIMAYDFTPVPSSKPGPIAPIDWVDKIVEYAVTKMPKEKIWLGIHLYSYEWVTPNNEEDNTRTNSYTYNVVKNQILNHDYVLTKYNSEFKEGYAKYRCLGDYVCELYYATPESVNARKQIAAKYQIAGITYWRLGNEDELIR